MKKRLFPLLCAVSLLCAVFLLSSAVSAVSKEGSKASNTLLSLEFINVKSASLLDQTLIGENLNKPASQLVGAALLSRMSGADTSSAQPMQKPGVPADMARDLGYAASKGWINAGSFDASSPLDANDWYAMLLRFLGYKGFDDTKAAVYAWHIGLASREYKGTLNGGQLAVLTLDALRFPFRDGTGTPAGKLVLLGKANAGAFSTLGISGRELSVREAADRHYPAVFGLDLESSDPKDKDGIKASGFFVKPDGTAVTCFHSLQGASKGMATLITGEQFDVQSVLWYDKAADLAVIRISKTSKEGTTVPDFAYLELGDTAELRPGEMSYAIGYPLGVSMSLSQGIISAVGVKLDRYSSPVLVSAATITYGSGGGVLLNTDGKVIGVTAGALKYGNEMYLSIPAEAVAAAVKNAGGGGQPLSAVGPANKEEKKIEFECEGEIVDKGDGGQEVKVKLTGKEGSAAEGKEKEYAGEGALKIEGKKGGARKFTGSVAVELSGEKTDLMTVVDY